MKGLSVILPVKPPEPYLTSLIEELNEVLISLNHEILVQTEIGLTNAVIEGVKRALYDTVVVMDADGSHSPIYLLKMYDLIFSSGNDLVIGSRVWGLSEGSPLRHLITKVYCKIARTLLNLEVEDPMSGFVMGRKDLFLSLKPFTDYKFILQLLTHNPAPKIVESPIIFRRRKKGKSKASLKTGFKTLISIFKLRR